MAGSTSASTSSPAKNAAAAQDELVLVMDFGSQTAQLITRRVRDQNVFCQLLCGKGIWIELRQLSLQPVGVNLLCGNVERLFCLVKVAH